MTVRPGKCSVDPDKMGCMKLSTQLLSRATMARFEDSEATRRGTIVAGRRETEIVKIALFGICCLLVLSCVDKTKMNKALSLTAVVTNPQIKSVPDSPSYQLRLPVTFTLTNGGDGSTLVIKNAMKITRVSIAASEEDLKSGKYVYDRQGY